jgi:hypothetical protein
MNNLFSPLDNNFQTLEEYHLNNFKTLFGGGGSAGV